MKKVPKKSKPNCLAMNISNFLIRIMKTFLCEKQRKRPFPCCKFSIKKWNSLCFWLFYETRRAYSKQAIASLAASKRCSSQPKSTFPPPSFHHPRSSFHYPPSHYLWHLSDTLFNRCKVKPCILRRNMHHFIAWFRIDYPLISMRLQKGTPHNTCMAHSFYSPIHVNHATIADWTGNRWWLYSIKTQNKNHMKILHIQNFILPLHPQLGENLNVMAG